MEEIKHILVPVDGSDASQHALAKAIYLAEHCGSALTLFTVVDMNKEINSFEQVSTGGYVPEELKEKGYEILTALMHAVPCEIKADAVVRIGDPAPNIIEYCEQEPVDLIVMGNRGLSHIKQILMGSVSQYVLLRSRVPVMINK
ncbi:MAG: universal stress protein [Megasphaera sp.]|jgi:nucleotide-binding universal stress UspA family protein|nr:universal stress protein [Megasphaera sp.]